MFTFQATRDPQIFRDILTDPRCWRRIVNDAAPAREEFRVDQIKTGVEVVIVRHGEDPIGVFALFATPEPGTCEVHFSFLPRAWGRKAQRASTEFLAWVWQNTPVQRLVGPVPSYNRLCYRLAKHSGFTEFDTVANIGTRRGEPFHHILMEIKRP